MTVSPRLCISLFALLSVVLLSSCMEDTRVRTTRPRNGELGVDPRILIAVRLSNTTSSIDDNLDSSLFRVTGDIAGSYSGTLNLAKWSRLEKGITADEFEPRSSGGSDDDGGVTEFDTLVFILPEDDSFIPGEIIDVFVSSEITARGIPLNSSKRFEFQVLDSGVASDSLRVAATTPAAEELGVEQCFLVASAAFNTPADVSTFDGNVIVRGEHSGVHSGISTVAIETEGSGALDVAHALEENDTLLPGERVEVVWTGAIRGAVGDGTAVAGGLTPRLLTFQQLGGRVDGPWGSATIENTSASPLKTLPADFLPAVGGVEFVIATTSTLDLYSQTSEREWTRSSTTIPIGEDLSVIDATLIDLERDGFQEIVVLLSGEGSQSELLFFEVDDEGSIRKLDDELTFEATLATAIYSADLSVDGRKEVVVLHAEEKKQFGITFFEIVDLPPDPDTIDPLDLASFETVPALRVMGSDPVPDFKVSDSIVFADLTGTGRLDLIARNADRSGLSLYRNVLNAETSLFFRFARDLPRRSGDGPTTGSDEETTLIPYPLGFVSSDLDADGDIDLVAWDSEGALLYRNAQVHSGGLTEVGTDLISAETVTAQPFPQLNVGSLAELQATSLDFDGDRVIDFLVARGAGDVLLLRSEDDTLGSYTQETLHSVGELPVNLAVADIDGDAGLDLALAANNSTEPVLQVSQAVVITNDPCVQSIFQMELLSARHFQVGESVEVRVFGDITETFFGYSIALDYDEEFLSFDEFRAPSALSQGAEFIGCPNSVGIGCQGRAAVTMSFLDETPGDPAAGIELGTFIFTVRTDLVEATQTDVVLVNQFTSDDTVFTTAVNSVNRGEAPVVRGDPVRVSVTPTPPPALAIGGCEVVTRTADTTAIQVDWSSPAGVAFDGFLVFLRGIQVAPDPIDPTAMLDVDATSATFAISTNDFSGAETVEIRGFPQDGGGPVSDTCIAVVIRAPDVNCEVLGSNQARVSWTIDQAVDGFEILRDGIVIATAGASLSSAVVLLPGDRVGGVLYQVRAIVNDGAGAPQHGPSGECSGGPVGDPDPGDTLPPTSLSASQRQITSDAPIDVLLGWENGEGYTSVDVTIRRSGEIQQMVTGLPGGTTQFVYTVDGDPVGIRPDSYDFSVRGEVQEVAAEGTRSFDVQVPALSSVNLSCGVDGNGDVVLGWLPLWKGYDPELTLRIFHVVDGVSTPSEPVTLSRDDVEFRLESPAPIGVYNFELVAGYSDSLPPGLEPSEATLTATCSTTFGDARVFVEPVETGVGLERVEIPLTAEILGPVSGMHIEIELPEFLVINSSTGIELPLGMSVPPGALTILPGTPQRAIIDVSDVLIPLDQDGDGSRDARVLLATLVASVPANFDVTGQHALSPVFGATTLAFPSGDDITEADGLVVEGGQMTISDRYVALDRVQVEDGSTATIPIRARMTFPQTECVDGSSQAIKGFNVTVGFDPQKLELVGIEGVENIGGGFFPLSEEGVAAANISGEVSIVWLGINLSQPDQQDVVENGILIELGRFNFRQLAGGSPGFARIQLIDRSDVSAPGEQPRVVTTFEPNCKPGGQDVIRTFLDGGVTVLGEISPPDPDPDPGPDPESLQIGSVAPSSDTTICGGTAVRITGQGFRSGLEVFFDATPALQVTIIDSQTVDVLTPAVAEGTTAVTLSLAVDEQSAVAPSDFTFVHPEPAFVRGDFDGDGVVLTGDAVALSNLVAGASGSVPSNFDAADANDDGVVDGGDVTAILDHLFGGTGPLPAPFLLAGLDPTPDSLTSCD